MFRKFISILTITIAILTIPNPIVADNVVVDQYELSLEENINFPVIPNKKRDLVKQDVLHIRQLFDNAGFTTGRLRQGEVLLITIPCCELFNSNSTQISKRGGQLLEKLDLLKGSIDKYKLLIAVHTDDTGEDGYADTLTAERANAINDYLDMDNKLKDMIIIPYGIGRDEPLKPNDSIKNRSINRRVEIYLIPLETLFSKK